jgi:hypothetical protein
VKHAKEIEDVLRQAVHSALISHKRAGNTIATWKDEKVQLIRAEDILVDPLTTTEQT